MFSSTFVVVFPLSEVVLIIPRCTALSTKGMLLLPICKKRLLKQILALPNSVADIAVYILTGILPIEAQIHIRALGLFNNQWMDLSLF
jgi:hypothetical protein